MVWKEDQRLMAIHIRAFYPGYFIWSVVIKLASTIITTTNPMDKDGPLPCPTPYNRKQNVLSASLNKTIPSCFVEEESS